MKKILIIEDEAISAERLKRMLLNIDDAFQIDGPIMSVKDTITVFENHNDYDIVFTDIKLLDGNIFDAFRVFLPNSVVVFTTAYDEFAMQAIKHNGLAYLLKPISDEELREAIEHINALTETLTKQNSKLREMASNDGKYQKRLLVYHQDELISIDTDDILYFYKDERKITVNTNSGDVFTICNSMQELEERLNPEQFFRLNRQYITHFRGIKKISVHLGSKLKVTLHNCDENIFVSKDRSSALKDWLNR